MNRLPSAASVVALLVLALLLAACGRAPVAPSATAPAGVQVQGASAVVFRSPTCSCCYEHEEYLRQGGFEVHSVVDPNVTRVKHSYGVPPEMYSCHTSDIGGYFVEGHVSLAAVERLLSEQPGLDGIALPGMPAGSPGMGGVSDGPLTVYGIKDGQVVGVFGTY